MIKDRNPPVSYVCKTSRKQMRKMSKEGNPYRRRFKSFGISERDVTAVDISKLSSSFHSEERKNIADTGGSVFHACGRSRTSDLFVPGGTILKRQVDFSFFVAERL